MLRTIAGERSRGADDFLIPLSECNWKANKRWNWCACFNKRGLQCDIKFNVCFLPVSWKSIEDCTTVLLGTETLQHNLGPFMRQSLYWLLVLQCGVYLLIFFFNTIKVHFWRTLIEEPFLSLMEVCDTFMPPRIPRDTEVVNCLVSSWDKLKILYLAYALYYNF